MPVLRVLCIQAVHHLWLPWWIQLPVLRPTSLVRPCPVIWVDGSEREEALYRAPYCWAVPAGELHEEVALGCDCVAKKQLPRPSPPDPSSSWDAALLLEEELLIHSMHLLRYAVDF